MSYRLTEEQNPNIPLVTQKKQKKKRKEKKKTSFTVPKTSHWCCLWYLASAFLVSLCVLVFLDLGSGLILRSLTSLPASDKFEGKLVGVPGAGAPNSCAGGLNGLAAGELVCARMLGNVPVTGVETLLAGAPNANPPVLVLATAGGWPNGVWVDGAALKGVSDLGAVNGDEGAVCPNGCAVGGALPKPPLEAAGGAPNVNGVLDSRGGVAPSLSISISSCKTGFLATPVPAPNDPNGAVAAAGSWLKAGHQTGMAPTKVGVPQA
jgi:hypothetical protein